MLFLLCCDQLFVVAGGVLTTSARWCEWQLTQKKHGTCHTNDFDIMFYYGIYCQDIAPTKMWRLCWIWWPTIAGCSCGRMQLDCPKMEMQCLWLICLFFTCCYQLKCPLTSVVFVEKHQHLYTASINFLLRDVRPFLSCGCCHPHSWCCWKEHHEFWHQSWQRQCPTGQGVLHYNSPPVGGSSTCALVKEVNTWHLVVVKPEQSSLRFLHNIFSIFGAISKGLPWRNTLCEFNVAPIVSCCRCITLCWNLLLLLPVIALQDCFHRCFFVLLPVIDNNTQIAICAARLQTIENVVQVQKTWLTAISGSLWKQCDRKWQWTKAAPGKRIQMWVAPHGFARQGWPKECLKHDAPRFTCIQQLWQQLFDLFKIPLLGCNWFWQFAFESNLLLCSACCKIPKQSRENINGGCTSQTTNYLLLLSTQSYCWSLWPWFDWFSAINRCWKKEKVVTSFTAADSSDHSVQAKGKIFQSSKQVQTAADASTFMMQMGGVRDCLIFILKLVKNPEEWSTSICPITFTSNHTVTLTIEILIPIDQMLSLGSSTKKRIVSPHFWFGRKGKKKGPVKLAPRGICSLRTHREAWCCVPDTHHPMAESLNEFLLWWRLILSPVGCQWCHLICLFCPRCNFPVPLSPWIVAQFEVFSVNCGHHWSQQWIFALLMRCDCKLVTSTTLMRVCRAEQSHSNHSATHHDNKTNPRLENNALALTWNGTAQKYKLSVEDCVNQAPQEPQHTAPKRHQYAPSHMERPECGQPIQCVNTDASEALTMDKIKCKQRAIGKFPFHARAIDNTMPHSLNDVAMSKHTKKSLQAVQHFLDCAASNPNAKIVHWASDMVSIQNDSDAAYLVCSEAWNRAGGHTFVGYKDNTSFNGPATVLAKVIKHVMSSAAKAETTALFIIAWDLIPLGSCLDKLGHKQPPAPTKTDNSAAVGIANNAIKQKRSKSMDMRMHWSRDRIKQKQFIVCWKSGQQNLADCPTKHHSGSHHKKVRSIHLHEGSSSPIAVQGCIETMRDAHRKPTRPTWAAHVARAACGQKRVTWWDQPPKTKSHVIIGTKTESSVVNKPMARRDRHKPTPKTESNVAKIGSFMTTGATTAGAQQQGTKPCICTTKSSGNGVSEFIKRLSFLV